MRSSLTFKHFISNFKFKLTNFKIPVFLILILKINKN